MSEQSKLESWWALTLIAIAFATAILLLAYLGSFVWPKVFDLDALQLLGANVIGVLLAAFFALEIERRLGERRERRRREKEEDRRREEARRSLDALRKAINHNDETVQDALKRFRQDPQDVVFFSTDPKTIESILPDVLDTTGDVGLVRLVNEYRYELEQLGRKLDAQRDLGLHPQSVAGAGPYAPNLRLRREEIVDSIIDDGSDLVAPSAIYERIEATRKGTLDE